MIVLTLKTDVPDYNTMNLSGIVPSSLRGLSDDQLRELAILVDERPASLGDYWSVQASDAERLTLVGDLSRCVQVAGGMTAGLLMVQGSVGDDLGNGMHGGEVRVLGDCGRFVASGLRGGIIRVSGNAGEFAAAARPGASRGMNGGRLVIDGQCDRWLAARMRRGLVVVRGTVGGGCAARMIAGTVVLGGQVEQPLGFGMKRGTVLHLNGNAVDLPATLCGFTKPEYNELSFLPMLLREVDSLLVAPADPSRFVQRRVLRSLGDRAVGGMGECLWLDGKSWDSQPQDEMPPNHTCDNESFGDEADSISPS